MCIFFCQLEVPAQPELPWGDVEFEASHGEVMLKVPRVVVFHHLHFIDLLNNVAAPVVAFAATWIHVTDNKPN